MARVDVPEVAPRRARFRAVAAGMLVLIACAGCTAQDTPTDSTPAKTTPATAPTEDSTMTISITVTVGDRTIPGRLHDNPAARALADLLPLTLSFSDYGSQEKAARLPTSLPMTGMPSGDDGAPGEIGYYAPNQVLVLYYEPIGHFNGIANLGTWDLVNPDDLQALPDNTTITFNRA